MANHFNDFKREPLSHIVSVFDFKQWPKSFSGSISNKTWGVDAVESVTNFYCDHEYITKQEMELSRREWPIFRNRISKIRTNKLFDVYVDLLKERDPEIKHFLILFEILCTFSASTAACERGFSSMNRQKTKLCTLLNLSTLNDIMRIGIDGPAIAEFDAAMHVSLWQNSGKQRLESGHKCSGKRQ